MAESYNLGNAFPYSFKITFTVFIRLKDRTAV